MGNAQHKPVARRNNVAKTGRTPPIISGKQLSAMRRKFGLSQAALGRLLGYNNRSYIWQIENNIKPFPSARYDDLLAIANQAKARHDSLSSML